MALRFQKVDDVDRAAKEERHTAVLVIVGVLYAATDGIFAWLRSESLPSYGKNLAGLIAFGFVYWLAAPFYYEFRIRTKEIDGKVSAIEQAVTASREGQAESLERLNLIEGKLAEIQDAR